MIRYQSITIRRKRLIEKGTRDKKLNNPPYLQNRPFDDFSAYFVTYYCCIIHFSTPCIDLYYCYPLEVFTPTFLRLFLGWTPVFSDTAKLPGISTNIFRYCVYTYLQLHYDAKRHMLECVIPVTIKFHSELYRRYVRLSANRTSMVRESGFTLSSFWK